MRYLHRTHRVSVAWLHERFKGKVDLDIVYEKSDNMCADIYTKAFTDKSKWQQVCHLINIIPPTAFQDLVRAKHIGDPTSDESSSSKQAKAALHKNAVHEKGTTVVLNHDKKNSQPQNIMRLLPRRPT